MKTNFVDVDSDAWKTEYITNKQIDYLQDQLDNLKKFKSFGP